MFASSSQVNFIVPDSVTPGPATISVRASGKEMATGQATIAASGPGIFTLLASDPSQPGAVENQDNSVNSESNPAAKGSVVQIFATGYGAGSDTVRTVLGDTSSPVVYSGTVFPGLWQINVQVPDGASGQVPVFLIAGGIASNGVTIWVR